MSAGKSAIVGIDLGTTNSVVAAVQGDQVRVLQEDGEALLPSVVGWSADGRILVGQAAKNQLAAFPGQTLASIKRRMGEAVRLSLGDQQLTPQEVSAMILRRLKERAERVLGQPVGRAVITVPAFFDEHQRQATREAGELAGLTVERIINEPTAASLAYHAGDQRRRHLIVYDLGGGTFDVSIVRAESGVLEVLSSRGDTHLGGDDFDDLLARHVAERFQEEYGVDLLADAGTHWRLMQACERGKCELSSSVVTRISEEFITSLDGRPLNLDVEVERRDYEALISPLLERTIQCVDEAIRESGLPTDQLDELILVGGSTRTPLVQERLREEFDQQPKWAVNPDLAVALGAATQAAMQDGNSAGPVLIDVATHTMGIEALETAGFGLVCVPLIRRSTPLPARYEHLFQTVHPDQSSVRIRVFQGESKHLTQNRPVGEFLLEGLNAVDNSDGEIRVGFELTLDGVLNVTATEARSGRTKSLRIDSALSRLGGQSRPKLAELFAKLEIGEATSAGVLADDTSQTWATSTSLEVELDRGATFKLEAESGAGSGASTGSGSGSDSPGLGEDRPLTRTEQLLAQARELRGSLDGEDAEDLDRLVSLIQQAEAEGDDSQREALEGELDDLLYYITE